MNTSNKVHFNLPIGAASILLIFLTLSLVSFAVLSLETATADLRLTQKSASYTQNYYAAMHNAEGFLADTDAFLANAYASSSADESAYFEAAGGASLSQDFPISDLQYLHVELTVIFPSEDEQSSHDHALFSEDGSFSPSCYFRIACLKVETDESTLEYSDGEVPITNTPAP